MPEPLVAAWAPFARRRALRLHARERFDCVITTSPPESVHLVGRALRRGAASPGSPTLRDAWTFEPLRPRVPDRRCSAASTSGSSAAGSAAADAVVCVSSPAADDLRDGAGSPTRW